MANKVKIIVAGIGGVGGYFGGLLARKYENSNAVEICFNARGGHLNKIRENGLKVIHGQNEFITKPEFAADNANEIGIADFILICTKSYDLDATIEQLKPSIAENPILLPLLNGVESVERIKRILTETTVLDGCVYIVSALKEAGVIENSGINQKLYFGPGNINNDKLLWLEKIMQEAGIEATLSDSISTIVWEKFIFIASIATATSHFNCTIGKLLEENEETLVQLIEDVKLIAVAKGISVKPDITSYIVNYNKLLLYDATSSMHRDFLNLKPKTEVETLNGYVVRAGEELKVETPAFTRAYNYLIKLKENH
ncbi:MAG: 2-dehydropantoate 2-reductase [Bacteroidales bacterium]|nr:2-dehydropantoate 2-reductase [Bacteroidales bacterium]